MKCQVARQMMVASSADDNGMTAVITVFALNVYW